MRNIWPGAQRAAQLPGWIRASIATVWRRHRGIQPQQAGRPPQLLQSSFLAVLRTRQRSDGSLPQASHYCPAIRLYGAADLAMAFRAARAVEAFYTELGSHRSGQTLSITARFVYKSRHCPFALCNTSFCVFCVSAFVVFKSGSTSPAAAITSRERELARSHPKWCV